MRFVVWRRRRKGSHGLFLRHDLCSFTRLKSLLVGRCLQHVIVLKMLVFVRVIAGQMTVSNRECRCECG